MNEVVAALRPRSTLGVIDDAVALVRRRWSDVLPLTAISFALVVFYNVTTSLGQASDGAVFTDPGVLFDTLGITGDGSASDTQVFLTLLLGSLGHAALVVSMTRVVLNEVVGRDEDPLAVWGRTVRSSPRWLVTWFVSRLAFLVGILFLGVGLVIAWLMFWTALPAASAEETGPIGALRRSRELTKGMRGRLFGLAVGAWLVITILRWALLLLPGQIASQLADGEVLTYVVLAITTATLLLTEAIWATIVAISYLDLRSRKEGLDLDLRVRALS